MLFFLPTAVMETCSSGEELTIKARKPYTITKQRERWTEEEHTRFLEALKLYGRAWQRIEEHIGTKTAVQIRSHAQKFFTKLEKEAVSKGIPLGQVHDIEIPPPRPKRKPTNPYPRKNGMGPTSPSGGGENDNRPLTRVPSSSYALNSKGKAEDLHADSHPQGQAGTKSQKRPKEASTDSTSPGALSLFHVAPPPSTPSSSKSASQPNIPLPKDSHTEDEKDSGKMMDAHDPESQRVKVPGVNQNPSSVKLPSPSAVSSVHQSLPPYPPALSWPHIPPAFSGHLMSALLQNPASHTAANLAASYWLTADMEAAAIDSASGSTTGQQMSSSSHSMAAAAAATVAAASAWWATHGLLPFCYPSFNGCFATFAPPPTSPATQVKPQGDIEGEEEDVEEEEEEQEEQEEEKGLLRASKGKDMSLTGDVEAKGSPLSSTDSNRSGKEGVLDEGEEVKPRPAVENDQKSTLDAESINGKGKKQVDRSSCGSNTPGSEVETDTVPPGADKAEDEEPNEPTDSSGRRPVDPRKEVSKEGRLAFQALFSREVLPQSFSPPKEEATALPPEVNDIVPLKVNAVNPVKVNLVDLSSSAREEAAVGQQRLKPQCTGFKPYKRCAVEAKEAKPLANEEECNKRIRLEREASTRAS